MDAPMGIEPTKLPVSETGAPSVALRGDGRVAGVRTQVIRLKGESLGPLAYNPTE